MFTHGTSTHSVASLPALFLLFSFRLFFDEVEISIGWQTFTISLPLSSTGIGIGWMDEDRERERKKKKQAIVASQHTIVFSLLLI